MYGNRLPQLRNIHTMLISQIRVLESYRDNLHSQLNLKANKIEDYKCSLEYYIKDIPSCPRILVVCDFSTFNQKN